MFSKLISRYLRQNPAIRIQIVSDLHFEVGQQYTTFILPTTARYLILAGDIGRLVDYEPYLAFLADCVSRFQRIFLVLGDHEFYGLDYDSGIQAARRLCRETRLQGKVTLLHRTRWDDPWSSLTLVGCTLWSAIPSDAADIVKSKVNDFKKIAGWTVQKHSEIHEEELAWLQGQVKDMTTDSTASRTLVVTTHHAPCHKGTSSPENSGNAWTSAFATDLISRDNSWKRVKIWIFGHTHYSNDFVRNGTRVVSNQRGYVLPGSSIQGGHQGRRRGHEFDPGMAISV